MLTHPLKLTTLCFVCTVLFFSCTRNNGPNPGIQSNASASLTSRDSVESPGSVEPPHSELGWSTLEEISQPPAINQEVVHIDGRLVFLGGTMFSSSVTVFHVAKRRWYSAPSMTKGRIEPGVVATKSSIIVAGGTTSNSWTSAEVEELDLVKMTWSPLPPLPEQLKGVSLAVSDQTLFAFGGEVETSNLRFSSSDLFFELDSQRQQWSKRGTAPVAGYQPVLLWVDGQLWTIGGAAGRTIYDQGHSGVYSYDVENDTWQVRPDLPRSADAAVLWENTILAFPAERYDQRNASRLGPTRDEWIRGSERDPDLFSRPYAAFVIEGTIVVVTHTISPNLFGDNEIRIYSYEPESESWTRIESVAR